MLLRDGKPEKALKELFHAIEFTEASGERWYACELYRLRAEALLLAGRLAGLMLRRRSCEWFDLARAQAANMWEVRAVVGLARLLASEGEGRRRVRSLSRSATYSSQTQATWTCEMRSR